MALEAKDPMDEALVEDGIAQMDIRVIENWSRGQPKSALATAQAWRGLACDRDINFKRMRGHGRATIITTLGMAFV
jgi:hypothetical protein